MIARRLACCCLCAVFLLLALWPVGAADKTDDEGTLQFRLYGSVLPGYNRDDARAATSPMFDIISKKVGVPIKCDVHDGTTPDDLFEFGKKLSKGEYHVAALWGIEYGWLREKYPDLDVLTVVFLGDKEVSHRTKLFVRKSSAFKKLADLKDKRLADYKDTPLMDRVFFREMLRAEKLDDQNFVKKTKSLPSVRHAAFAVKNGDAECVIISNTTYARLKELQPGLANSLVELKSGEIYPSAVLIGVPSLVEKVRKTKGLWTDLRDELLEIHKSSEGKECVNFWRFDYFVKPDKEFRTNVDEVASKYPVKVLLNLDLE